MEAQRGYECGSSLALIEGSLEGGGGSGDGALAGADLGLTQAQVQKVSETEVLVEERDAEIKKARGRGWPRGAPAARHGARRPGIERGG
jgi:hypothetical protein